MARRDRTATFVQLGIAAARRLGRSRFRRVEAVGPPAAVLLAVLAVLWPPRPARAQCFPDTLLATIHNPVSALGDLFGYSVAVSGNVVVVGAQQDDTGGFNSGAAYILDASTGALVTRLSDPFPAANDWFGASVSVSGNLAVVGVPQDDAGRYNSGTAHVFNVTTGALLTTLANPAPARVDLFGWSVAVSGNLVVVGAYRDDAGAIDAGTAYVFDATTGALRATLSNPAPAATDYFGWSVAVSGSVAVVGAYADDAGATDAGTAYVFDATTGAPRATLGNPAPAASDHFGYSVAVSGNVVVVGARLDDAGATDGGTAYVFDATTGALATTLSNPAPKAIDFFGQAVAVSGNVVVVGANMDDAGATNAGTAYVFSARTGTLVATPSNPAPSASDQFGWSVAVSGNMALVGAAFDDAGAADSGSAYTFSCKTDTEKSYVFDPGRQAHFYNEVLDELGFGVGAPRRQEGVHLSLVASTEMHPAGRTRLTRPSPRGTLSKHVPTPGRAPEPRSGIPAREAPP